MLSQRSANSSRFRDALATEQCNSEGERAVTAPTKKKRKSKPRKKISKTEGSDPEDGDFEDDSSSASSEGGQDGSDCDAGDEDADEIAITNSEVSGFTLIGRDNILNVMQLADILLSKPLPQSGRGSSKKRKRREAPTVVDEEDQDSPRNLSRRSATPQHGALLEGPISEATACSTKKNIPAKQVKFCRNFRLLFLMTITIYFRETLLAKAPFIIFMSEL